MCYNPYRFPYVIRTDKEEFSMIEDPRIRALARNLVGYSCRVQPGENVLIEANGVDYEIGRAHV